MKKEVYFFLMRNNLAKELRERFNYSNGATEDVADYNYSLRRLKSAKTVGDLFAIAKELEIGLGSIIRLALDTVITDLKMEDVREIPNEW